MNDSMKRSIPTMQSLLCFESAAKLGNYSHAANELFLTQSAVSRQIQQLESFLKVTLFTRTQHGVELTTAGHEYYKNIKPLLMALEQSSLDISSHQGNGGTLKLGVVPTFATRWLVPKISDFHQKYPNINIQMETYTKPFLLSEYNVDAAIIASTPQQIEQWAGIKSYCLMQEDLIVVCSPKLFKQFFPKHKNYDLQANQLEKFPLLQQTTRPSIWQEFFQNLNIHHHNPYKGQKHELFSMLSEAAIHSIGIALLPKMLIEYELKNKLLIQISNFTYESSRHYYFIHSSKNESIYVKEFFNWLKNQMTH
jgi:LysR family transcriptional regulator, glycine cleavage system transcriptional activator